MMKVMPNSYASAQTKFYINQRKNKRKDGSGTEK